VTVEKLSHGFDDGFLFNNGNMIIDAGERVAIIGENGAGKTTFLRCLLGELSWMSQWRKPNHDDQIVRATLGRLLFSADDYKKKVNVCSGGEKNRLLFGKLMMSDPNVMLLDEPTNHLDMESIEALNLALENYDGSLFFVSHDREFVSSLATHIIEVKNKELVSFKGTYNEYLDTVEKMAL